MKQKLLDLTQRRGELLARIAVQREQMAMVEAQWNAPLALADQGMGAVRFLRQYHLLIVGVMALWVARRRNTAGLMWGVWRLWKGCRDLMRPLHNSWRRERA